MKILVACEYSGVVREAFRKLGHDSWSCDLLPSEIKSPSHYQGYLEDFIGCGEDWDMIIAFPPCTYLASSGAKWFSIPERMKLQEYSIRFVNMIWNRNCERVVIENPVGILSRKENLGKPSQYIQPYQFGHLEQKKTCLWIKGLPNLVETKNVYDEMMSLPKNIRERVHHMSPSSRRGLERSRTYQGIADAMANQWGSIIPSSISSSLL